jgi:hypothetical protein
MKTVYTATTLNRAKDCVRPFVSSGQFQTMSFLCRGREGAYFERTIVDLANMILGMPKTFQQDKLGNDAQVFLHYYNGASDWYIYEKDVEDDVSQASGFVILNGDHQNADRGYVNISEITRLGAELDLHFKRCTLAEIRAQYAPAF